MSDLGLRRCPYCHTSIEVGAPVVACEGCLAPHHEPCWDEAGCCSACKATVPLRPGGRVTALQRVTLGLLGLAATLPVTIAALAVYADYVRGVLTVGYLTWIPVFFPLAIALLLTLLHAAVRGPGRTAGVLHSRAARAAARAGIYAPALGLAYVLAFLALEPQDPFGDPYELTSALPALFAQWIVLGVTCLGLRTWQRRSRTRPVERASHDPRSPSLSAAKAQAPVTPTREGLGS